MICGFMDVDGTIYYNMSPTSGSYFGDIKFNLKNNELILKNESFKLSKLKLSKQKIDAYIGNGWSRILSFPHFKTSTGYLYETKNELIFIGEISKREIDETKSRANKRMLMDFNSKGYKNIFIISKNLFFGFKIHKNNLYLYIINGEKEFLLTISKVILELVKRKISMLKNLTYVENIRQLKRDNPSARSYGSRKSFKIETALWLGLFLLGVGLSLFLTALDYIEVQSIPISNIDSLADEGELVKIEGEIDTEGIVIWWKRSQSSRPTLYLHYNDYFTVSDDTGTIEVDLSQVKDIGMGRHDDISFDLENCYIKGDSICIVGRLSDDSDTLFAEYIEQSHEDFGKDIDGFYNVGLFLVIISLFFLTMYIYGYRNYMKGVIGNLTMLAPFTLIMIVFNLIINPKYQIYYYIQLILVIYFVISIIAIIINYFIKKKIKKRRKLENQLLNEILR
jgi:hypothetical protein